MSYIQSVYNRLPDDIIEGFDGSNLDVEIDGEWLVSTGVFWSVV